MKRSVNLSRTRKPRNVNNDIALFLSDIGVTSDMLRAVKRDADEDIIQAFLTEDWERSLSNRAAWDRGEEGME